MAYLINVNFEDVLSSLQLYRAIHFFELGVLLKCRSWRISKDLCCTRNIFRGKYLHVKILLHERSSHKSLCS